MASSETKSEAVISVEELTKRVKGRTHAAVVIANQCEVPLWLLEMEESRMEAAAECGESESADSCLLPPEALAQMQKHEELLSSRLADGVTGSGLPLKYTTFHSLPSAHLKGTFTDAFAVYHSLRGVEGMAHIRLLLNASGDELNSALNELLAIPHVDDFVVYYCGLGNSNGDWVAFNIYDDCINYVTLQTIVKKWRKRRHFKRKKPVTAEIAPGVDDSDDDDDDAGTHVPEDGGGADDIEAEILKDMSAFEGFDEKKEESGKEVAAEVLAKSADASVSVGGDEAESGDALKSCEIAKTSIKLADAMSDDLEDDSYLLIVSDTNFSGQWAATATVEKLWREHVFVQSAVGKTEEAMEVSIGNVIPNTCWLTQISCGHFTHSWLQICNEFVRREDYGDTLLQMRGSFALLRKAAVWDTDEDNDYALETTPMSNCDEMCAALKRTTRKGAMAALSEDGESDGESEAQVMVCFPCYGAPISTSQKIAPMAVVPMAVVPMAAAATAHSGVHWEADAESEEKKEVSDEELDDATVATIRFANERKPVKKRTSHLPKPSVRRLGVLGGIKGGLSHLRKASRRRKKTGHWSQKTRGGDDFLFTKVLRQIRTIVVGDSEDDDYASQKDEVDAREWIDG